MPKSPPPPAAFCRKSKSAEGNTVQVNTVVGTIGEADGAAAARSSQVQRTAAARSAQRSRSGSNPKLPASPAPAVPSSARRSEDESRRPLLPARPQARPRAQRRPRHKSPAPASAAASPNKTSWPSSSTQAPPPPHRSGCRRLRAAQAEPKLRPAPRLPSPAISSPCRRCARSSPSA